MYYKQHDMCCRTPTCWCGSLDLLHFYSLSYFYRFYYDIVTCMQIILDNSIASLRGIEFAESRVIRDVNLPYSVALILSYLCINEALVYPAPTYTSVTRGFKISALRTMRYCVRRSLSRLDTDSGPISSLITCNVMKPMVLCCKDTYELDLRTEVMVSARKYNCVITLENERSSVSILHASNLIHFLLYFILTMTPSREPVSKPSFGLPSLVLNSQDTGSYIHANSKRHNESTTIHSDTSLRPPRHRRSSSAISAILCCSCYGQQVGRAPRKSVGADGKRSFLSYIYCYHVTEILTFQNSIFDPHAKWHLPKFMRGLPAWSPVASKNSCLYGTKIHGK